PLIKHYFEDGKHLEETALKYIRVLFQRQAIDALEGKSAVDVLARYVDACFFWMENFESHALTWQAFLHRCSKNKKSRDLNTLATSAGEERLMTLLQMGQRSQEFKPRDPALTAKLIQALITGSIVCLASENFDDASSFKMGVRAECLR